MAGDSFRKSGRGQPLSSVEAKVTALPTGMVTVTGEIMGVTRHTAGTLEVVTSWQPKSGSANRANERRINRCMGAA